MIQDDSRFLGIYSLLDVKDAEGLVVPLAMFPSEDEPADLVCTFLSC